MARTSHGGFGTAAEANASQEIARGFHMIAAATLLAEAGVPVFPCNDADKRPLVQGGFHQATTDAAQIAAWWALWPNALPGVPTGERSGLWVADLDVDKRTGENIGVVTATGMGLLPHPWACQTRSNGMHLFFRWQPDLPRCSTKLLPGIDIRGTGGYVVAWDAIALAAAATAADLPPPPTALVSALGRNRRKEPHEDGRGAALSAWAETMLRDEIMRLLTAPEGERNDTLNTTSFWFGRLVGGGEIEPGTAETILRHLAHAVGLEENEINATIKSGLDAGVEEPVWNWRRTGINCSFSFPPLGNVRIMSSSSFVSDFRPPDYLIYPILQQ